MPVLKDESWKGCRARRPVPHAAAPARELSSEIPAVRQREPDAPVQLRTHVSRRPWLGWIALLSLLLFAAALALMGFGYLRTRGGGDGEQVRFDLYARGILPYTVIVDAGGARFISLSSADDNGGLPATYAQSVGFSYARFVDRNTWVTECQAPWWFMLTATALAPAAWAWKRVRPVVRRSEACEASPS